MKTLFAILAILIFAAPAMSQEIIGCEHQLDVFDLDYCRLDRCGPCNEGEGDCDSDSECGDGLICNEVAGIDLCSYPITTHTCPGGTHAVIEVLSNSEVSVTCTER